MTTHSTTMLSDLKREYPEVFSLNTLTRFISARRTLAQGALSYQAVEQVLSSTLGRIPRSEEREQLYREYALAIIRELDGTGFEPTDEELMDIMRTLGVRSGEERPVVNAVRNSKVVDAAGGTFRPVRTP